MGKSQFSDSAIVHAVKQAQTVPPEPRHAGAALAEQTSTGLFTTPPAARSHSGPRGTCARRYGANPAVAYGQASVSAV